jgi:hypothetical protein
LTVNGIIFTLLVSIETKKLKLWRQRFDKPVAGRGDGFLMLLKRVLIAEDETKSLVRD